MSACVPGEWSLRLEKESIELRRGFSAELRSRLKSNDYVEKEAIHYEKLTREYFEHFQNLFLKIALMKTYN